MRSLAEENNKAAKRVLKLIEEPSKMLSAVLICNNIVNLSASSISTSYAFSICKRIGMENSTSLFAGIATGILTVLILIFGEITPKNLATKNAEKLALFYASSISAITHAGYFYRQSVCEIFNVFIACGHFQKIKQYYGR